ncbi:MAG: helix-turn-helix transcriptional regulator, partial [Solirubrobacterales bacterium]|nr:helix-turn-helix transcriptional regulator [Solirubrobacterales bacterium]
MYLAFGSIIGNTFVREAAANTVGLEPPDELDELDECVVVVDLLLPQPTTSAHIAIAAMAVSRTRGVLRNFGFLLRAAPGSEQPTSILAMMTRGAALRERRLQCGLSQTELAARAGVSRQLVAAVEAGRNTPAVDAALRLARALATTVEELFCAPAPRVVAALGGRLR